MKKILLLSTLLISILSSCSKIDPIEEKAEYTDCVTYAVDTLTNIGVATDYTKINVSADATTMLFSLKFSDLKLQPNAALQTVTVSGLTQYLKDVVNPYDGETDYLYTFFSTNAAYTDGISIRNFKFGWLSTVYWCTFTSDSHRVWILPKKVQTYANRNLIINSRGDSIHENAIHPRYDFEINTGNETISFNGMGVTFPTTNQATGNIEFRNQYSVSGIKIQYTPTGFTASAAELMPVTDGETGKYKILDFHLQFDADYDDEREARYKLVNVATRDTVHVTTRFGYKNERKY